MSHSANIAWIAMLKQVSTTGVSIAPRGIPVKEALAYTSIVDMRYPIVTIPERDMGYKFMFAESWWILSGRNDLASIAPYSKEISRFSDDSYVFDGAYGPMVVQQTRYVVDCLIKDPNTRQAVISIWRPNPRDSKDVPCTVSLQFLIRQGKLCCVATMRSSDAWLGWVYDVFNFSMVTYYIREMLAKKTGRLYAIGDLFLTAGSQHIYSSNDAQVAEVLAAAKLRETPYPEVRASVLLNHGEPRHLIDALYLYKDQPSNFLQL